MSGVVCYTDYSITGEGEWSIRTHHLTADGRSRLGEDLIFDPTTVDMSTFIERLHSPYSSLIISRAKTDQIMCEINVAVTKQDERMREIKVAIKKLYRA